MAQQWPTTAPSVSPGTHDPVATQAYQAGGGDYFRSGYYSAGLWTSTALTTSGLTLNRLIMRPFVVPVRRAFDRIGINVTTAGAAGAVLRFGLYTAPDGVPTTLVVDAGTVAATTTGAKEAVISLTLDPGVYWAGVVSQVATATVTALNSPFHSPHFSVDTTVPTSVGGHWSQGAVSGALPATLTSQIAQVGGPGFVCLRAA